MGIADLIPGVSGGTIAFITGIYERLVAALHNIDHSALKLLLRFRIKEFLKKIDAGFLALVIGGAITSILLFSKLIEYLLKNYEVLLWSFFFGLILASIYIVLKKVREKRRIHIIYFFLGAVVAFLITSSSVLETPDNALFLFLSGFIAIIAMILPGISGSYILLILGKYKFVISLVSTISTYLKDSISSVSRGDFGFITSAFPVSEVLLAVVFTIGCIAGLITFSKILTWLFKHYHDNVITILAGFMLGSLNVIWPWKKIIGEMENAKGEIVKVQENILPYFSSSEAWYILVFIIVGFLIVYTIDKFSSTKKVEVKSE